MTMHDRSRLRFAATFAGGIAAAAFASAVAATGRQPRDQDQRRPR